MCDDPFWDGEPNLERTLDLITLKYKNIYRLIGSLTQLICNHYNSSKF